MNKWVLGLLGLVVGCMIVGVGIFGYAWWQYRQVRIQRMHELATTGRSTLAKVQKTLESSYRELDEVTRAYPASGRSKAIHDWAVKTRDSFPPVWAARAKVLGDALDKAERENDPDAVLVCAKKIDVFTGELLQEYDRLTAELNKLADEYDHSSPP